VYIAFFAVLGLLKRNELKKDFKEIVREIKSFDKAALVLIVGGVILQTYPVFGSGMRYAEGIRFFHVNGTDGVLHLGYIQSMMHRFPPIEPGISAPLVNYHYWSDLVISELARVWKLPVIHLFFQYLPPLISAITAFAVYLLIGVLGGEKRSKRWALFLLFFAGDGAYLVILIFHQYITFRSPALDNGALQFLNMPHVFAKMIFLSSLIPFTFWIKTYSKKWGILTFLLWSALIGFKVYFAIFVGVGMICVFGYKMISYTQALFSKEVTITSVIKKEYFSLVLLSLLGIISACIYLPPNRDSGGLLFSQSQWMLIFFEGGALDLPGIILRRNAYWDAGNRGMAGLFELGSVAILLFSIFGSRMLGFFPGKNIKSLRREMVLFFIPGSLLFIVLGLYTVQVSGGYNVYNFFVIAALILTLFASFNLAEIQRKNSVWGKFFLLLFILITVPRVLYEMYNFTNLYSHKELARVISNEELAGLQYLKNSTPPDSKIQTHPNNLWDHDAPYTIFITDRDSFLTGAGLLRTHNQPVDKKSKILEKGFQSHTPKEFLQFMQENKIDFVILQKKSDQQLNFPITQQNFRVIFENDAVTIFTSARS
jgi:hypothetical protein